MRSTAGCTWTSHLSPEDILFQVDIASMANSLECRSPFLDHQLIEFACSLPGSYKLTRGGRHKHILKEAFKDWLPPGFMQRKKQGFFRAAGELGSGTISVHPARAGCSAESAGAVVRQEAVERMVRSIFPAAPRTATGCGRCWCCPMGKEFQSAAVSAMSQRSVYQVNLQYEFGGGEVFTRFFTLALIELGYRAVLFVSRKRATGSRCCPPAWNFVPVWMARPKFMARAAAGKGARRHPTALDAVARNGSRSGMCCAASCTCLCMSGGPGGFRHYNLLLAVPSMCWTAQGTGYSSVCRTPVRRGRPAARRIGRRDNRAL